MTDKKPILEALNQVMRSLDPDRSTTAYDPVVDAPIMERLLSMEGFELGSARKIGSIEHDRVHMVLRALDRAGRTSREARSRGLPDPVSVSRIGMDWSRIKFEGHEGPDLEIRMPLVLDGRWIGDDRSLLLDTASRAVLDAAGLHISPVTRDEVFRRMNRAGAVAMAMTSRTSGPAYHVVLPSPFGPAELRSHDSTGVPYVSYDLPEAEELRDLPHAYEIDVHANDAHVSIEIRRARCFNASTYGEPPMHAQVVDTRRAQEILASVPGVPKPYGAPDGSIPDNPTDDDLADAYERQEAARTARRRRQMSIEDEARLAADAVRAAARPEMVRLDAEMEAARLVLETIRTAISRRNPLVGRTVVVPAVRPSTFSRGKGERRGVVEVYADGEPHSSSRSPDVGQLVLRITRADGTPGLGVIAICGDVLPDGWCIED